MGAHEPPASPFHLSPVQPGDILLGRYRVERILGVGGMGVVVAARHLQLDSLVAVKFLLPEILDNAEAVSRFAREAKAAVKIQNEHVSRVIDVGALENGAPYMVMEHLEGTDLGVLLRTQGRLSIDDAVDFVLQASEAIAEAHSLGIVHRDLKPPNLFLVRRSDGSRIVKVLDFGISKTIGNAGPSTTAAITGTASMMGSPLYMSPEQLNSARDIDARTDIWSLGIILYELLTGELPFMAETIPQLCVAILQAPPSSLRALRPDVPPGLEAIVMRCLEKDRALRYPSVGDLARALAEYAPAKSQVSVERITHLASIAKPMSGQPNAVDSDGQAPRIETVLVTASGVQAAWGHTSPEKKVSKRRNGTLALALLAAIAAGAIGFIAWRGSVTFGGSVIAAGGAASPAPFSSAPLAPAAAVEPSVAEPAPSAEPERDPTSVDLPPVVSAPTPTETRKPKGRPVPPAPRAHPSAAPPKRRDLPGSGLD